MPAAPRMSGRDDDAHAVADVGELEDQGAALRAALEVLVDLGGLAAGETAARVRAELVVDRRAPVRDVAGEVLLEVRLPQALTGPVGQGGDAVRRESEQGADLGGGEPFDLGVPEHGLPPFGQRPERGGDQRLLESLERGVDERAPRRRRASGRRWAGPG